jgi:hypothetical protein
MNRGIAVVFFLLTLIMPELLFAASAKDKTILLNVPESVLAQAIEGMVPFDIDPAAPGLQGSSTVSRIDDLKITEQNIFCKLRLSGKKLQILTEIAGHQINLKVGEIELNFNCIAHLRYDSAKQILYIKPTLSDISSPKPSNTDIGGTLLPILNEHEFPVTLRDLQPLIADTSDKTIAITMHIADIRAVNGALQLNIVPQISSNRRVAGGKE